MTTVRAHPRRGTRGVRRHERRKTHVWGKPYYGSAYGTMGEVRSCKNCSATQQWVGGAWWPPENTRGRCPAEE